MLSEGDRLPYPNMTSWGSVGQIQSLEWTLAKTGLHLGDILSKEFQVRGLSRKGIDQKKKKSKIHEENRLGASHCVGSVESGGA